MTDTGNNPNEPTPSSVHGDAETDLAAREGALTGAREQQREQQGVSEATTAGMPSGTTIPPGTGMPPGTAMGTEASTTPVATNDTVGAAPTAGAADQATGQRGAPMTEAARGTGGTGPLLGESGDFTARWQSVQVIFVDEPRRAVEDADRLVREVMDRLTQVFSSQRDDLEKTWHAGGEASTEDLRVALQRYRSFFERLLAA